MRARVSWCDGVTREKRLKMTPYIYLESQNYLLKTLYLGGKPRHTCVTPASHPAPLGVTRLPIPAPCLSSVSHLSPLSVTPRCDAVTPYMCCFLKIIALKNPYMAGQFSASHRHTKRIGFCYFLHFNLSPGCPSSGHVLQEVPPNRPGKEKPPRLFLPPRVRLSPYVG